MTFNKFKNNSIVKIITNIFVIILIPYLIWMFFFDENSYLVHRKFDKEINDLESTISFYEKKIAEDKAVIKRLSSIRAICKRKILDEKRK
jgi:cell division protein FtsL